MEKCCRVKFKLGPFGINFNPIVTVASIAIIWGFVAWSIAVPKEAGTALGNAKKWVTDTWTWLYVGTQDVWAIFIIYLCCSKYGKMKLGQDDEKPEWSDSTYFTMLFAAGIGIGLFFFGVAEPIYHYRPGEWGNRYYQRYSDNQMAQDAINLTFFHWGVHGWIVYVLVGLLLGVIAYRNNLPMSMRTCFYPLLGDRVFGRFGDIIDILSIVSTMFGVCTSLGLGAMQFNQGLIRNFGTSIEFNTTNQVIIIWAITACATLSVVSGLSMGIRRLSEVCFSVGMLILLIVFFADDTWYSMNIYTQSIGYYTQWLVQLGWHTDAFAMMGNAPDGKEAPEWMDAWTIFYWGWWIAWSPFVGMFIARISKGRTIREFVMYTMFIPQMYIFFWFSVFGGIGIRMQRQAEALNITCDSPLGGKDAVEGLNGIYKLSCRSTESMWFDVVEYYGLAGNFLAFVSLIGILLYFVTSSDSGSLVIDCLAANGLQEPPMLQRIFWAVTEGVTATALLLVGKEDALKALQTVSVCAGLFYTVILNFMCVALWRSLKLSSGEASIYDPEFATGLLDPFFKILKVSEIKQYILAIVAPWWGGSYAGQKLSGGSRLSYMIPMAVSFYLWIILMIVSVVDHYIAYIAWAALFGMIAYLTGIRSEAREKFSINGNLFEDFFASMLAYPLTVIQLENHMEKFDPEKKNDAEQPGRLRPVGAATAISPEPTPYPMKEIHHNKAFEPENGTKHASNVADAEMKRSNMTEIRNSPDKEYITDIHF